MVFIWRSRRRRDYPVDEYGRPYDPYAGGPYGGRRYGRRRGYGYGGGGGGSCLRDMFLLEGGCCLAEAIGCGPSLVLIAPSALRRRPHGEVTDGSTSRPVGFLLNLISAYKRDISAHRAPTCRFSPTCSTYAAEALQQHGLLRGLRLTIGRLLRCRPGGRRGDDPVPPASSAGRCACGSATP